MNESTVFVFSGRDKFKPGLLCHAKHKDLRMVNQSVNKENGRWTKVYREIVLNTNGVLIYGFRFLLVMI